MRYIYSMILAPNISIDKDNLALFNASVKAFDKNPAKAVKHWHQSMCIETKAVRTPQGNGILLLCTDKNGDAVLVARLVSAPVPPGSLPWGRKVYVMDSIRVHNDWIGEGAAPMVYRWLSDNGYTVISDSHQTTTSLAVWRKMGTQGGIFTVNLSDGSWRPYDHTRVEDWMLFGNGDGSRYWPIRFVLPAK